MASDEGSAWYLHSQGRRFGPLNEDEMRGYFRAGMVKSVDRISVPGNASMLAAAEVAAMLGETAPVGPPPPPLVAATPASPGSTPPAAAASSPVAARTASAAGVLDERAANAIAQINMELASMAAAGSSRRKSSGWLLPVIAGVFLVALMLIGLNMVRKMGGNAAPRAADAPVDAGARPALPPGIAAGPAPAAPGGDVERWSQESAQLSAASNWTALVQHATQWTNAQPDNVDAWQALGLAQSRLGKVDEAKAALDRVLTAQPENINARILLAEALLTADRWTDAASAYKQLVAVQSQNPKHWNNYGVALRKLGEHAQAIAALETAVRLDPGFRDAWNNLGETYQAAGDSGRATAAYSQANALR